MSIQNDRWITRMAQEHGMIEPFEGRQVREGVISYGVSSYGYDMRVAREFRIFTNVLNSIVDPKDFDPKSFVEFEGDICIVPPNSFALARSVEYFRIPRDVMTITVGKSTYARCFRGDTRVALVDGSTPTLEEMARRSDQGELFWGYSIGEHGRMIVSLLEAPRFIGRDSLIEVELDNGRLVHCTPDHEFLLRDGRLAAAHELRPGSSLMPLYRRLARGYEMVYQPLNGHLHPTHRLSDEWNVRNGIYEDVPGTHRHHKDWDRRNNAPWNIERMLASDHVRMHDVRSYGEDFDPADHGAAIQEALARRSASAEWRAHQSAVQGARARRFWNDPTYAAARDRLVARRLASWTPERRTAQAEAMREYFRDQAHRAERGATSRAAWSRDDGSRREAQRSIARAHGRPAPLNHKVAAVRELPGDHDVFCLTVPEAGNFALDAGVMVKNCGIITNVTPFEPEWEGFVTLEISNTTPLPAKIYANEGIAQVLFFKGEEPPEVSYGDKKGKYQGQHGVTLPRL